jgi:hypothetical protein
MASRKVKCARRARAQFMRAERRRAKRKALKLLQSRHFFIKFLLALRKVGLVGEELNALILLIVVVSRVLDHPLSVFVKGHSSAGKNWLVSRILRFLPKDAIAEITSVSDTAWSYSGNAFRHKVVYLQERNEQAGNVHPIRLLISERKLIRCVTRWVDKKLVNKKYVARGPVASVSTTTKNHLEIDDETRHISIWVDESPEQTRRIVTAYTTQSQHVGRGLLRNWRMVQRLLEQKGKLKIVFPKWFREVEDRLFINDLRVRRYYPAFVEACRVVSLIRSFQRHRELSKCGELELEFADFAITALIFDTVFVESLRLGKTAGEATRRLAEEISKATNRPVEAKDLVRKLKISTDQAYAKLRYAASLGVILRANEPEKGNRKLFLPAPRPRFVPDPEKLFHELDLKEEVRFVHPVTGEWIVYRNKHN